MKKLNKEQLPKAALMIVLAVLCLIGAIYVLFFWK
jgi:hypothetical protein